MQTVVLLVITWIGWGIYHNFIKLATKTLPPPAIPIIFSICSIATVPLYHYLITKSSIKYNWDWAGVGWAIAAYVATAGGSLAYMFCLSKTNVSNVVGIASSYPLLVMLIAVVFMKEQFSLFKLIGTIFILMGVFISTR